MDGQEFGILFFMTHAVQQLVATAQAAMYIQWFIKTRVHHANKKLSSSSYSSMHSVISAVYETLHKNGVYSYMKKFLAAFSVVKDELL